MYPWIKRTAMSLCLVSALATPALAGDPTPITGVMPISAPVEPIQLRQLPSAVTVNGQAVAFDQAPIMVNGVLMVPLRAIAEAAGGTVTWDEAIRLVHVEMPDRTILVHIGQVSAEMHEEGVFYLTRNWIDMAQAPVLEGGRTLVSADALTAIFGFQVRPGQDGTLGLTAPSDQPDALDISPATERGEPGTISQAEAGDRPRILLSGAPMANGEARLTWVWITEETRIIVQEGDQQHAGSIADLAVGARAEVKFAGPLLMSYPAQGSAAEILVQK